jgi:DNA-binding transcriptional MerR regulator
MLMQSFTIRDMENLTGIKAHTLRIWEQRYPLFQPKRKESRHRIYDNEDLKKLLRISFLYHGGWKISRIASLSEEQILSAVDNVDINGSVSNLVNQLLESAIDFNEAQFGGLLHEYIRQIGFERCITEVCYPFLQKIGLLWTTNKVIPGQEHFSSYLIQNKIIVETEKLELSSKPPQLLLFCPKGEFHELPLLFINYLLKKNGRSTIYLGINMHKNDLLAFRSIESVQFVYLHLITNFTGLFADDYLEDICRNFSDKIILASGEGIRQVQRNFVNLRLLKNDRQIYEFIQNPEAFLKS